MHFYQLYGTEICSDCAFPLELPLVAPPVRTDAARNSLHLSATAPGSRQENFTSRFLFYHAHGRKVFLHSNTSFEAYETGQPFCYEVENVLRFYWRSGEGTIFYILENQGDEALLTFWFIHQRRVGVYHGILADDELFFIVYKII